MIRKMITAAALLSLLAALPACFEEPVKPLTQEEHADSEWLEPTTEDAVVDALLWCYTNREHSEAMSRYESLLHSEFFYQLAAEDRLVGTTGIYDRAGDIANTAKLFDRSTTLELSINSRIWFDQPELNGELCDCCRTMTTSYYILAQFGDISQTFSTRFENASVTMIVCPGESDPETWVIRAIYDLGLE
jgi:hypothetical protein